MLNQITLTGTLLKNGKYFILQTDSFTILVISHSFKMLEAWIGESVTISGSLQRVSAFHVRAEKITAYVPALVPAIPLPQKMQKIIEIAPENQMDTKDFVAGLKNIIK